MQNILVLIDFTDGCKLALQQTRILAELTGAHIHAIHVDKDAQDEVEHLMLSAFVTEEIGTTLPLTTHLCEGRLVKVLTDSVETINPDLVVLCTHGVQGIIQKLFGANVLKLVQAMPRTFLIVQENSRIDERGFQRILFPATHSAHAERMIQEVMSVAAECDSEVVFYEIDKYFADVEADIKKNFDAAKKALKEKGVRFTHVKEQPVSHSLGFVRQTLEYAEANEIGLIATLSEVVDAGFLMMKSDKETLLTNEKGIPVLACG
jgi:nucleotide-binding universal stress UspA family protein